jgi:hypothetical protein
MFLAAVACPRYNENGACTFDGKIGIWPFIKKEKAKRSSANRPAVTMETKCIVVTKEVYTTMVLKTVLPAIEAKWPLDGSRRSTVYLQHDNAKTHFDENDALWKAEVDGKARFQFRLKEQAANSPDQNWLDLGFFASLQSLQFQEKPATSVDELIANVNRAWEKYDAKRLNRICLSHQSCMDKTVRCAGDNTYDIPHLGKEKLEREGKLPKQIKLTADAATLLEQWSLLPS